MCVSMADIQSATAENRRGKKKKKETNKQTNKEKKKKRKKKKKKDRNHSCKIYNGLPIGRS